MTPVSQDSFDAVPSSISRHGTHRVPKPKRSGWFAFGWAALATGVLVGAGALGLYAINNNVALSALVPGGSGSGVVDTGTPTPTIVPTTDPAAKVTVLNGTDTVGLATRVGDAMEEAGWTVDARTNADSSTVTQTTVYYHDAAEEPAALGLAQALGGVPTLLSQDFLGADLTVVLGSDYTGPGAEAPLG